MSLIIIIATIWGISALISHSRQARLAEEQKRQREAQARLLREQRTYAQAQREETYRLIALEKARQAQEKLNEKFEREQARQAEQLAKHEKRIADLETRMSQAEYDIRQEKENLDHFTGKLADLDEEKRHIEWEIESWKKQRHLANIAKCEKKLEKVEDNIFSFESKVRAAEKRLDKAQRTKDFCEKQMSA